eukprot:gene2395-2859_t
MSNDSGVLVHILKLEDLAPNPFGSETVNPSVSIKCGSTLESTTIKKKTFNPTFGEVFFFQITDTNTILNLEVKDNQTSLFKKRSFFLGSIDVKLKEVYLNEKIDFKLQLERVQKGTIFLSIQSLNFNKTRPKSEIKPILKENSATPKRYQSDSFFENFEDEEKNSKVSRYEIETKIGKGGMGTVYKARDIQKDRVVALKKVICEDSFSLNQAMKEVTPMLKISHENLVKYTDFYFDDQFSLCIVMDFYENGDLDQYLKSNEISKDSKISFMKQLTYGVHNLHKNNLVHRDLKQENIFLCENFTKCKIGDFGLVKDISQSIAKTFAGTQKYMAPELFEDCQKQEIKFGKEADIWSLGVIFFEICTKDFKKPLYIECFKNEDEFSAMVKNEISKNFSQSITETIVNMLKRNPSDRPTTNDIIKALNTKDEEKVEKIESEMKEEDLQVVNLSKFENSPVSRYGHSMTLYSDSIYIFGGVYYELDQLITKNQMNFLNDILIFNISKQKWMNVKIQGEKPSGRHFHSGIISQNKLYIFGGKANGYKNDHYSFDLNLHCWTEIKPNKQGDRYPAQRYGHVGVSYKNFNYIHGGFDADAFSCSDLFQFDCETETWKEIETKNPPKGRFHHKALMNEGKMFIVGGIQSGTTYLNDCWMIDLETFEWTEIQYHSPFIPQPRYGNQLFSHFNNLYLFGGCNKNHDFSEILKLDLKTFEWTNEEKDFDLLETTGTCYTGIVLNKNIVYFYGGNIKEFETERDFLNEITKSLGKQVPEKLKYLIHLKYSTIEERSTRMLKKIPKPKNEIFMRSNELLNQMLPKKLPKKTILNCMCIGDQSIGKTSFLYRVLCEEFPLNNVPKTIDSFTKNIIILNKQYSLNMMDFDSIQTLKIQGDHLDIVFLCFSVDSIESYENVFNQWNQILQKYAPKCLKILCGFKYDLKRNEEYLNELIMKNEIYITQKEAVGLAKSIDCSTYLEISSITGEGIENALKCSIFSFILKK